MYDETHFIHNILLDLGFSIETQKQSFFDKIRGKRLVQFLSKGGVKMNMDTYEFFNNGKSLGVLFNTYVDNVKNVKELVTQMIRENKLNRIINEDKNKFRK